MMILGGLEGSGVRGDGESMEKENDLFSSEVRHPMKSPTYSFLTRSP